MTRETGVKAIGVCHGFAAYRQIARVLGLDPDDISFEAPGVNHCIWMTQCRYRGEDAYPLIERWIDTEWSKRRPWSAAPASSRAGSTRCRAAS